MTPLKGTARVKHGKRVRIHVVGKAAVPGNWQNFMQADSNKTIRFPVQGPPSGVL